MSSNLPLRAQRGRGEGGGTFGAEVAATASVAFLHTPAKRYNTNINGVYDLRLSVRYFAGEDEGRTIY